MQQDTWSVERINFIVRTTTSLVTFFFFNLCAYPPNVIKESIRIGSGNEHYTHWGPAFHR